MLSRPANDRARVPAHTIPSAFNARSTALQVVQGIDLHGRRAIVTGGASGLGLETSRALAQAGAQLTLAVRNRAQGDAAAEALRAGSGNQAIQVALLDLADLASVRRFADDWGDAPLHILINNAAIMACPLARSVQGWESQFATNHLGHFALTQALLPALLKGAPSRVVALSSSGHKLSAVHFDDIHFERRDYNKWLAYRQAKSANALMTLGLHLRHGADGITANAVHPGGIMTGLQKFLPLEEMRAMGWLKADDTPLDIFKTPEQGASTSVWAATAPELTGLGGRYFEDCAGALPAVPGNRVSGFAPHIMDEQAAARLWDLSRDCVGSGA
jgi:NAD(P)-dependent dehydrogenase (short-subunit alcohol dehydrogenase family)